MTLIVSLGSFSNIMSAQTNMNNQSLDTKAQSVVTIAAFTANGDLEQLRKALNGGLDSGLTINETKEMLAQLYAYCGFPRSLNAINTLMSVVEDRKKRGITDKDGKTATPLTDTTDKYERGRKRLETLTGQPQSKPAKGFGEFSPTIDRFLKEHLFADIFDSDVLSYQQRELITISALATMPGVQPQLESHLSIGMNTGLTVSQLNEVFDLIGKHIDEQQAEAARKSLVKVTAREEAKMGTTQSKNDDTIFPRGKRAPADYFTGTVYLQMLAEKTESNHYSLGSVTFEPGARSNWHTHPAGQTLIVINGEGLYQERGKPIKTISKGQTIVCNPNVEHWHGASPKTEMTHIAVTNDTGGGGVVWLKPVTDDEYKAGA